MSGFHICAAVSQLHYQKQCWWLVWVLLEARVEVEMTLSGLGDSEAVTQQHAMENGWPKWRLLTCMARVRVSNFGGFGDVVD